MRRFLKNHWPPVVLVLITILLSALNYTPGTYLTGWDTLHPEFDFGINFKRLINGVWRPEQGLGAIAGHSHMSDLPRIIFMYLMSAVAPLSFLRYSYVFLCLILGPLGIYYLIRYLLTSSAHHPQNLKKDHISTIVGFLAGLLYIFNLSTVQIFAVPFEMFPTQYAALPWIMLFSLKFLRVGGRKNLLILACVTLISTPQAYAAHLWIAFFPLYVLFLCMFWVMQPKKEVAKRGILLIVVTILVNSYWLLPNLYYDAFDYQIPIDTKQNRIFSQEYRIKNREFGYIADVSIVRGFLFNWEIHDFQKDKSVQLLEPWRQHLANPIILTFEYIVSIFALAGIILAVYKKKKLFLIFIPFVILPVILLTNSTPPFSNFFDFLILNPLLRETLRFVFTKLAHLLLFAIVIYFSLALSIMLPYLTQLNRRLLIGLLVVGFIAFGYPAYQGNLISPKLRINIPQKYFDFWQFMKHQDDGVVLSLPLHEFTGWTFTDWEYQGSGFLWFGLKQPLIDRDNDRWSKSNERAYREFWYALYSQNPALFASNLEKFNIQYIEIDTSVISESRKNENQIIFTRETNMLLDQLVKNKILTKIYDTSGIRVYKTSKKKLYISAVSTPPNVGPPYIWTFEDEAFRQYGTYTTRRQEKENEDIIYPFRAHTIVSDRLSRENVHIDESSNSLFIPIDNTSALKTLLVPEFNQTESIIYADLYYDTNAVQKDRIILKLLVPNLYDNIRYIAVNPIESGQNKITINGKDISYPAGLHTSSKTPIYLSHIALLTKKPNMINGKKFNLSLSLKKTPDSILRIPLSREKIDLKARDIYNQNINDKNIYLSDNSTLTIYAKNSSTGVLIDLKNLHHSTGYILVTQSANKEGIPFRVCLRNLYSKNCVLYDELSASKSLSQDAFLIPPMDQNLGYTLSFDSLSYGSYASINELSDVTLYPIPYNFLSQLQLINTQSPPTRAQKVSSEFKKISSFKYIVQVSAKTNSYLILKQSSHPGWLAFQLPISENKLTEWISNSFPFILGKRLEHVEVDNWANGWKLEPNSQNQLVVIIFWPQYLEFAGFGLLILAVLSTLYLSKKELVVTREN